MKDPGELGFSWARPGGTLHAAERALRFEELRRPLGMPPGSERYGAEDACLHLVAREADRVIACVLFHPDGEGGGRLLQMAVTRARQRRGVGRALVGELERRLVARGVREVTLHARAHALGFYERLGYTSFGEPYHELGIPHRHMRKQLSSGSER